MSTPDENRDAGAGDATTPQSTTGYADMSPEELIRVIETQKAQLQKANGEAADFRKKYRQAEFERVRSKYPQADLVLEDFEDISIEKFERLASKLVPAGTQAPSTEQPDPEAGDKKPETPSSDRPRATPEQQQAAADFSARSSAPASPAAGTPKLTARELGDRLRRKEISQAEFERLTREHLAKPRT